MVAIVRFCVNVRRYAPLLLHKCSGVFATRISTHIHNTRCRRTAFLPYFGKAKTIYFNCWLFCIQQQFVSGNHTNALYAFCYTTAAARLVMAYIRCLRDASKRFFGHIARLALSKCHFVKISINSAAYTHKYANQFSSMSTIFQIFFRLDAVSSDHTIDNCDFFPFRHVLG